MTQEAFDVLLVTGMSGAGRSTAARALEDAGWFVIDNIPPMLIGAVVDVAVENPDVHSSRCGGRCTRRILLPRS